MSPIVTSYTVSLYALTDKLVQQTTADGIEQAREVAVGHVLTRMDAFGEDREALQRYGFLRAESAALDMPEDGATITLQDGYSIKVEPV